MTEYIEKGALYNEISELEDLARQRVIDTPTNSPAYPRYVVQLNEREYLKSRILAMPAADVAPVVHAKWVVEDRITDNASCSNCGVIFAANYSDYPYCPACGAKMDKEN